MKEEYTVLFVDDDMRRMSSFVDMLEWEGYTVLGANSVDKARRLFRNLGKVIDLVVLDIMMPPGEGDDPETVDHGRSTGLEFLKEVRKELKKLPVIVLSIRHDHECKNAAEEAGASDYLEKPCRPSVLLRRIDKLLWKGKDAKNRRGK